MAAKLERPPYAHNWARYVHSCEDKTTKELVSFAQNIPQITYIAGQRIIRDRITLQLDPATARTAAGRGGHLKSRPYVREYVDAFLEWDDKQGLTGLPSYSEDVQPFRISRDIYVPVKPLVIVSVAGRLQPVFSVGWASVPFTTFQMRLLMTLFEDAVFSLEDYRRSNGVFATFPKEGRGQNQVRKPHIWQRGDYDLLSKTELRDAVELYLVALERAKKIIAAEAPVHSPKRAPEHPTNQPQLPF